MLHVPLMWSMENFRSRFRSVYGEIFMIERKNIVFSVLQIIMSVQILSFRVGTIVSLISLFAQSRFWKEIKTSVSPKKKRFATDPKILKFSSGFLNNFFFSKLSILLSSLPIPFFLSSSLPFIMYNYIYVFERTHYKLCFSGFTPSSL